MAAELAELGRRMAALHREIEAAEQDWFEAEAALEAAT
jgi:hypothetical protein